MKPVAVTKEGRDLIRKWEGEKLQAYQDGGGVWTIGIGITAAAGLGIRPGPGVRISQAESERLFRLAVDQAAEEIRGGFLVDVTDNQFSACVSLSYNIGAKAFLASTLLRRINARQLQAAADQFPRWCRDNGRVVQGLVNRRAAERALFLKP